MSRTEAALIKAKGFEDRRRERETAGKKPNAGGRARGGSPKEDSSLRQEKRREETAK